MRLQAQWLWADGKPSVLIPALVPVHPTGGLVTEEDGEQATGGARVPVASSPGEGHPVLTLETALGLVPVPPPPVPATQVPTSLPAPRSLQRKNSLGSSSVSRTGLAGSPPCSEVPGPPAWGSRSRSQPPGLASPYCFPTCPLPFSFRV